MQHTPHASGPSPAGCCKWRRLQVALKATHGRGPPPQQPGHQSTALGANFLLNACRAPPAAGAHSRALNMASPNISRLVPARSHEKGHGGRGGEQAATVAAMTRRTAFIPSVVEAVFRVHACRFEPDGRCAMKEPHHTCQEMWPQLCGLQQRQRQGEGRHSDRHQAAHCEACGHSTHGPHQQHGGNIEGLRECYTTSSSRTQ